MSWKQTTLDFLGDALRFIGRACALIIVILVGLWSVWFVANLLSQLKGYCGRTIFGSPW